VTSLSRRRVLVAAAAVVGTSVAVGARRLMPGPGQMAAAVRASTGTAVPVETATVPAGSSTSLSAIASSPASPTTWPSASTTASAAPSTAGAASTSALAAYVKSRPGRAAVAATDLATGRHLAYHDEDSFITASIVKVEILVALLSTVRAAGRELTSSQERLSRSMITASDNDAASRLWGAIGGSAGLARVDRRLGLDTTAPGSGAYWGDTRTTARDQLRLLRALTDRKGPLDATVRDRVLDLMEEVEPDQRWGVPAAARYPDDAAVKNGWLATVTDHGLWTVNSIGRITAPTGRPVLIAVLTAGSPSMTTGITTVEQAARVAVHALT